MKKYFPYIIAALLLVVIALLFVKPSSRKVFDKRINFRKTSSSPYGTELCYQLLPQMFPGSEVIVNRKSPSKWYITDTVGFKNTLLFILTARFSPSQEEMDYLKYFVRDGNYVFICSPQFSDSACRFFGVDLYNNKDYYYEDELSDSVYTNLNTPLFAKNTEYFNPGFSYGNSFYTFDSAAFYVAGTTGSGRVNFLKGDIGSGSFFLHCDPFLFANYFIVHGNNHDYFEKTFSLVPSSVKKIIWDEYSWAPKQGQSNSPSPFKVLFRYEAFSWAIILSIVLLALYILLNVKRRQRIIPVIEKPKNESLYFVKTIGRLYFEKQDHLNLVNKMLLYFLEHVRSKYFINTSFLNDEFVQILSGKSGYPEEETKQLIQTIHAIQLSDKISQQQLIDYYQQFQKFYKYTN